MMTTTSADTELRELFDRLCAAWGDATEYGDCFTEDCDYVPYDGSVTHGRPAMIATHDRLFRGVLMGSTLVGDLEQIRYPAPDVAIMHATASVLMPWRSTLPKRRLSRQTLVAVRTDDGWRMSALHNGRVRPVTIPAPDSFPARASQLIARIAKALGIGRR